MDYLNTLYYYCTKSWNVKFLGKSFRHQPQDLVLEFFAQRCLFMTAAS
jgi:hypothetical protein